MNSKHKGDAFIALAFGFDAEDITGL